MAKKRDIDPLDFDPKKFNWSTPMNPEPIKISRPDSELSRICNILETISKNMEKIADNQVMMSEILHLLIKQGEEQ